MKEREPLNLKKNEMHRVIKKKKGNKKKEMLTACRTKWKKSKEQLRVL